MVYRNEKISIIKNDTSSVFFSEAISLKTFKGRNVALIHSLNTRKRLFFIVIFMS